MSKRMTIRDIAGFCPENAVWKMLADISALLIKDDTCCFLTPESIVVDGDSFIVESEKEGVSEFLAPEQEKSQMPRDNQKVWSLGAVAYYMVTGHVIFGGHGSVYQKAHPSVPLPVMPKGLQALTSVLQKCLCYIPDERVNLKDLNTLSLKGLTFCEQQQRSKSPQMVNAPQTEVKQNGDKWPEEMKDK